MRLRAGGKSVEQRSAPYRVVKRSGDAIARKLSFVYKRARHVPARLPPFRAAFSPDSRTHERPRPRLARDGQSDDRPSRAGIREADARDPGGAEGRLPD